MQRPSTKRGFFNLFRIEYSVVNVGRLAEVFPAGTTITPQLLCDLRVLRNFAMGGETRRLQLSVELFNMLGIDNVVYGPNASFYGPGITESGTAAPVDPRFQRLKLPDGTYDANHQQVGNPFQAQVGLRFYF